MHALAEYKLSLFVFAKPIKDASGKGLSHELN